MYSTLEYRLSTINYMRDIKQILSSLGLLDSEVSTYLAALKNGPSSVLDLTKLTKLSRQGTYTAIQQLIDRGLMSSVVRGKKTFYAIDSPDKLITYAERKQSELKEQLKDLKSVVPELKLKAGGEKPVVKMYEGKEGIRAIIENLGASDPKFLYEMGDREAIFQTLTMEDLEPYRKMIDKKKVVITSLYRGKESVGQSKGPRYFLPEDTPPFSTNIIIDDKKVTLVTFKGKMHSVVIENEDIAETLKQLFELALDSKKLKKG